MGNFKSPTEETSVTVTMTTGLPRSPACTGATPSSTEIRMICSMAPWAKASDLASRVCFHILEVSKRTS